MIVSLDALETMQRAADELYQLKKKAEADADKTAEAKLARTLSEKWGRMLRKIDAVKLLLEPDATEDVET